MSQLLKQTHSLYQSFYDKDGNLMETPVGSIARLNVPEEHIQFLKRYMEFIMNSKILNEATRIYIMSPLTNSSINSVFVFWNSNHPDQEMNVKTGISNVDYCRKKLLKAFDDDMIAILLHYPKKADLAHYEEQLEAAIKQYARKSVLSDKLTINIGNCASLQPVSRGRLDEFMEAIGPYRSRIGKAVETQINEEYADVIGYLNYLQTVIQKSSEQERVWNDLVAFLNGANNEVDF